MTYNEASAQWDYFLSRYENGWAMGKSKRQMEYLYNRLVAIRSESLPSKRLPAKLF